MRFQPRQQHHEKSKLWFTTDLIIGEIKSLRARLGNRKSGPFASRKRENEQQAEKKALPALLYFEPHIEEASRTRNRRLGTRRGSVVSAVAGPSLSAEMALFFLFTAARNHEEAGRTQKESGA